MKNYKKGFVIPLVIAIIALLGIGGGAYVYVNNKSTEKIEINTKKINDAKEVKNSIILETEARIIAEKSCVKGGEVLSAGIYNPNSKTWWYDANLNATREGCNPACVVSEETKTAEINWRCTGLKNPDEKPVACTMDAKMCPDGSYVGRSGPKCEFVCPSNQSSITLISPNGGEILDGSIINKITWTSSNLKDTDTISIGFRPMSDLSRVCWLEGIDEPPIMAKQGSFDIIPGNIYCTRASSKWDSLSRYKIQLQVNQYTEGFGVADMSDGYFIIK